MTGKEILVETVNGILQNMHHPSICFWGVQNEIAMFAEDETTYKQVRGLNDSVKESDITFILAGLWRNER